MRRFLSFEAQTPDRFKKQLLAFGAEHSPFVLLENRQTAAYRNDPRTYSRIDCLAGLEAIHTLGGPATGAFEAMRQFASTQRDWLLGYLGYDLKNDIEHLHTQHADRLGFDDYFLFVPRYLFFFLGKNIQVAYLPEIDDKASVAALVERIIDTPLYRPFRTRAHLRGRTSRTRYLEQVRRLQEHIAQGDVYEINHCIEFFDEQAQIDPVATYWQLREANPAPFMAFVRHDQRYLLSASPERFLKRIENKLIAQPMKGTAPRSANADEDLANRLLLENDPKERAENIMIVDLVRNDLTKVARRASVAVEELCKVYSFKRVHQMISTISARLDANTHWVDALRATFPMGSMTGAPKLRAMQLIDQYEDTRRGLYSGALGYLSPTGDFDFSVVIRSLLYNEQRKYLSLQVGSAITNLSKPEAEWDECQLKAQALLKLFENPSAEYVSEQAATKDQSAV